MKKPWNDMDFEKLSDEAETGTVGQGAVVEATRRLIRSVDRFSRVSTWLALAMIFLGAVQIIVTPLKK